MTDDMISEFVAEASDHLTRAEEILLGFSRHPAQVDAEAINATGLRELREESGYEPAPGAEVIALGHFFPSCGFTDEHSHLLLVRPVVLSAHGMKLDSGEMITEARLFTREELRGMIATRL